MNLEPGQELSKLRTILMVIAMLMTVNAYAKTDPVYTGFFSNVAVGGYDVVAYFTDGKAVEGDSSYSVEYMDTNWRFSTQKNLDAFKANPEYFAPQYGGYCAWAVSQGYTASGNPENWRIEDDRLYLNYNPGSRRQSHLRLGVSRHVRVDHGRTRSQRVQLE